MLRLAMAAARCPGCGELREPGLCVKCGTDVPAAEELSEIAGARREALASLLERAEELWRGCDGELPKGAKITADQLAGSIAQSRILERLDEAELACQRLSGLELDEEAALGTTVRTAVAVELDLVEEVKNLCLELARFDVSPPQPELRRELIGAARCAVEMLMRFLETVSAPTIPEVRGGEERLQAAIRKRSLYGAIADRAVELFAGADFDSRISLATGQPGSYVDAAGFVEPARIFTAFAGEEGPYERLAEAAVSYFGYLLPGELEPAEGAILILAAVNLSSLDRPLLAHGCAAEMTKLVAKAAAVDPEAVEVVFSRSAKEGPKLFAAASRVKAGMRLLRHASELEEIAEELFLKEVMSSYLEIAESAFRSVAWAVLGLQDVIAGKEVGEEEPPTLGSLKQRLAASDSKLAQKLGEAVDPELRNAAGHAEYRWDPEAAEVENLKTGRRWSVDELEERAEALGDSVVGVDAGYQCGLVASGIELHAPVESTDPGIRRLFIEASFSVAGYELADLSDDGATATVRALEKASLPPLMTAVAAQSALVPDADSYCVLDADSGAALLDVPAERMSAATQGPSATRDLEVVQCFTDSEIRIGRPASVAARDSLGVLVKIVAVTALRSLAFEDTTSSVVPTIRERAEAVLGFANSHPEIEQPVAQAARRRMERMVADTYPLERGEPKALKGLLRRIQAAFAWADRRGVSWPPQFKQDA
jgi:hypothetical protein